MKAICAPPYRGAPWSALALACLLGTLSTRAFTPELIPADGLFRTRVGALTFQGLTSRMQDRVVLSDAAVYLADGYAGLGAFSLADPAHPRLLGRYSTGGCTESVRWRGDRVYARDSLQGWVGFEVLPSGMLRRSSFDLDAEARLAAGPSTEYPAGTLPFVAAVVDERLYLARDDFGVVVLPMQSPSGQPHAGFRTRARINTHTPVRLEMVDGLQLLPMPANGAVLEGRRSSEVTDGSEEANPPRIALPARPWASWPVLQLSARFTEGVAGLQISGPKGQRVLIQRAASVLGEWTDWRTIVLPEAPVDLVDEEAGGLEQMFYRLR